MRVTAAFEVAIPDQGGGTSVVTVEHHPMSPGRVRLVLDVDDTHYSGEVVLTSEQLDALLGVITTAAARG